jgi:UDP-N-acetyl-D-glucosamine dehydrogenase
MKEQLKQKVESRTATVAVFGLGYVGLPLAVEQARAGFDVLGIDRNPERVACVNRGENYITDVDDAELAEVAEKQKIIAYHEADAAVLSRADVILICVPTPLTKNLQPDLSYVEKVTEQIALYLHPGQLVTLESTTYPGTTEEIILPRLAQSGLKVGEDFFLAFSPERVDPGNVDFKTKNTTKVVGGVTPACKELASAFYRQTIEQVVPVSSPAVAEMTKVFENTYRAVNIALVNELALLCDKAGIDVWEVLDAAATKPFGIQVFYPGPGVGGHCIPIDPFYLAWKAREYDFHTRFIELAGEINIHMPYFVVNKIARALNEHAQSLNGARILLLGVAYKKDVDDYRESPALKIFSLLEQRKAQVSFFDPHIRVVHHEGRELFSAEELSKELLEQSDCVVITTDHSKIDYQFVVRHARLVLDTRNATRHVTAGGEKIIKL